MCGPRDDEVQCRRRDHHNGGEDRGAGETLHALASRCGRVHVARVNGRQGAGDRREPTDRREPRRHEACGARDVNPDGERGDVPHEGRGAARTHAEQTVGQRQQHVHRHRHCEWCRDGDDHTRRAVDTVSVGVANSRRRGCGGRAQGAECDEPTDSRRARKDGDRREGPTRDHERRRRPERTVDDV